MDDIKLRTRAAQMAFCRLALGGDDLVYTVMGVVRFIYNEPGTADYVKDSCVDIKRDLESYLCSVNDVIAVYNASLLYPVRGTTDHVRSLEMRSSVVRARLNGLIKALTPEQKAALAKENLGDIEDISIRFAKFNLSAGTIQSEAFANGTLRLNHSSAEISNERLPMLDIEE